MLLSSPSIIHGIDFCCVEYYMVFTFPRIIQQGKQIVFFGGKVNINGVRESTRCLSLMENNLFSCLSFEGAVISAELCSLRMPVRCCGPWGWFGDPGYCLSAVFAGSKFCCCKCLWLFSGTVAIHSFSSKVEAIHYLSG